MDPKLAEQLKELTGLIEQLKDIKAEHKALGDELRPHLETLSELQQNSAEWATKSAEVRKLGEQLVTLQEQISALEGTIEAIKEGNTQDARSGSGPGMDTRSLPTLGGFVAETEVYKHYSKAKTGSVPPIDIEVKGALLGGLSGLSYEQKDSDRVDPDDSLTSEIIDSQNIITPPRRTPVHRQIFTVVPLVGTDKIRVKRRVRPLEVVTKVTSAQTSGNTTLVVNRLAGLSTKAPFDSITVHNSSGPETFTVASVSPTSAEDPNGAGTITLSAALSNNVALGDLITWDMATYIADAELRPKARATYEDVTVNTYEISEWVEVTDQELRYAPALSGRINGDLLEDVALTEEGHVLRGDGTTGHFDGLLNSSSIGSVTWSGLESGTTKLDCILHAITVCETAHYMPTGILLHPQDYRDLMLSRGTDGQFIYLTAVTDGGTSRLWGLRVWKSTMMPAGTAVVGDMRRAVRIYDSLSGEIAVGYQNDQFGRGARTIRCTINSGMLVAEPSAVCKIVWDSEP